jgi:hypothetical protein
MSGNGDEIRAYYADPYGRRPPSVHQRADTEQPVEVAGQPGLLTGTRPRERRVSHFSRGAQRSAHGMVEVRVPLGPEWPALAVTQKKSPHARHALDAGAAAARAHTFGSGQGVSYLTGNPRFDERYQVQHGGAAPKMLERVLNPVTQSALCARDRVTFLRMERVLWISYDLWSAQEDFAEATQWVLWLAGTVMRSPELPLGR